MTIVQGCDCVLLLLQFFQLKDELMKHDLPLRVLTTMGVLSARIQR